MKKLSLVLFLGFLLGVQAFAQTRDRVFDNFDTSRGVTIISAPTNTGSAPNRKLIKKTAQVSMSVSDSVGLRGMDKTFNKLPMASNNSMGGFTTGDAVIDSYIVNACKKNAIDPLLIYSQMHQESSFKLKATSYKGARGLMQLMPGTAARFGVSDIYDPRQNIEGGVKYMRWLLDMFNGDVSLALAGYNAGEGAVMKYGNRVPPYNETQEYVRRISARYESIRNPNYIARTVKKVSVVEAAKLEKKEAAPLTVYEPSAMAIRLPDGRMRLVNQ
jgi:Transglycosylase SLT domain